MTIIEAVRLCDGTYRRIVHPQLQDGHVSAFSFLLKKNYSDGSWRFWNPTVKDILRDDYEVKE